MPDRPNRLRRLILAAMILLDSSFLCAWHNKRDVHHAEAHGMMQRFLAGDWGRGL